MGSEDEGFNEFRERMNERIMSEDNLQIKRFFNLDDRAYDEGSLDKTTKEMLGLVASMVLKCDDCIKYHLQELYLLDIEEDQLWEVFNIALVVGGSIVIPHLREAVDFWDRMKSGDVSTPAGAEKNDDTIYSIYTDGACAGNPGPGGYAALILQEGEVIKEITGYSHDTTNNRMELKAVIAALEWVEPESDVRLYCDSQYVVKGLDEWMKTWRKNGWQTSSSDAVKNRDLWEKLDDLRQDIKLNIFKVPAHSGHELNERVDSMAKKAIRGGKNEDEKDE